MKQCTVYKRKVKNCYSTTMEYMLLNATLCPAVVSETLLIVSVPDQNQTPNETLSGVLTICPSLCAHLPTQRGTHPTPQFVEIITTCSRPCDAFLSMHHPSPCPHLASLCPTSLSLPLRPPYRFLLSPLTS